MLEWLTGNSHAADNGDASMLLRGDDAPATPAPLFALRAFQHAIYGTPKPNDKPVLQTQKAQRKLSEPSIRLTKDDFVQPKRTASEPASNEPPQSPSKQPSGILLTPGTLGNRRKTVSFGSSAQVDRLGEVTNSLLSTTPKTPPRRYVSSQTASTDIAANSIAVTNALDKAQTTKEPAEERSRFPHSSKGQLEAEGTVDMNAPFSASGKYWKSEFDSFSSKSSLEVRKLVKKEQLAKKFAKHKDEEAARLSDLLRREQRRVLELEEQVADYVAQLSSAVDMQRGSRDQGSIDLRSSLTKAEATIKRQNEEITSLQASLRKSQAETRQLRLENGRGTSQTGTISDNKLPSRLSATQRDQSSDIWADAGGGAGSAVKALPSTPSKGLGLHCRSPLRPRDSNRQAVVQNDEKPGEQRRPGMTDERREAARRRLEEKRKKRATSSAKDTGLAF